MLSWGSEVVGKGRRGSAAEPTGAIGCYRVRTAHAVVPPPHPHLTHTHISHMHTPQAH